MSCVNTKLPEFIELAKKMDLSIGTLELIVHEFQNTEGNKGKYPPESYIINRISGQSMTNASEDQVKLWENRYSNPIIVDTSEEANKAITDASRFFSKESIKMHRTNDGKYKITVARPYTEAYIKEINRILENAPRNSEGKLLAPNGKPSNLTEQQYATVRTKAFIDWFGDWINDPENASKIVDENGEPLVVYHGSRHANKFEVFDASLSNETSIGSNTENSDKFSFFVKSRDVGVAYSEDIPTGELFVGEGHLYETFLNIRNPFIEDYEGALFSGLGFRIKWLDPLFNTWEEIKPNDYEYFSNEADALNYFKKLYPTIELSEDRVKIEKFKVKPTTNETAEIALNDGYDGVIIKNVDEGFKFGVSIDYVTFNPNQIKSATDNVGTFSTENDNIYQHKDSFSKISGIISNLKKNLNGAPKKEVKKLLSEANNKLLQFLPNSINLSVLLSNTYDTGRMREGTANNDILQELVNLEKASTPRELNSLFALLSSKFNMPFRVEKVDKDTLISKTGDPNNRCFITREGNEFVVYVNKDNLPSYTILAEEMLHPIVDSIQRMNPELFNSFLKECLDSKDPIIKSIVDSVKSSYINSTEEVQRNEIVTQILAYKLKNADSSKASSTFKQFIKFIVNWLNKIGIFDEIPNEFTLDHLAYCLKFENIKLDISRAMLGSNNMYEHSSNKESKDLSSYNFYSGGAKGSDTAWSEEAEKLGITTKHYTPNDWDNLSNEWKNKLDAEYQEVVSMLGRKILAKDSYSGKLVRRDMMQADKADAIFAIGTVASNGYVDGGTGYATTRGILRGIPVYLFDQSDNKWKVWDNESKSFVETSMPRLTPNAATIGTRELKDNGRQAIRNILQASIGDGTSKTSKPNKRRTYTGKVTSLSENQVFVFGSNPEGIHGAGAAKVARNNFGAVYGQGEGMQGQSYALPTKRIKSMQPSKSGQMTFSYGDNKRSDVQSSSTFEAIINGERTATTRYLSDGNIEYWKDLKVGDIVAFKSAGGKGTVFVRITKHLTQLTEDTTAEEWSKKEGWSIEYYESKVKPKVLAGDAYQMEYEFIDAYGERTVTPKEIRENIKRMYEVARNNPDKEFIVAYSKDGKNLNGYTSEEMAEMFASEEIPSNIVFEEGFSELVSNKEIKTNQEYTPIEQPSTDFSMFESKDTSSTEIQDEETTALVNEIDAVNESVVMTSTEVTKVAQKISYWISDKITEFAKNPELIFIKFPDKRTLDESGQWTEENKTKDIEKVKSMSRLSLIRFITPGNLLELCKMEFDKSTTLKTKKKVRFIKSNWSAIVSLGSKTLAELEKVTFANDNASEVLTMEDPDFNSEDTTEGVQETQGNLQEQWQIETKTKDIVSTMSQLVRLELSQCFELEKDGFNEDGSVKYKRVKDEFGMDDRVEEHTVVQSLLSWFKGVENINDMISTLESKLDKNPWVSQLLDKLKDDSGNYSNFQSQFFSTFYTAFQTYSVVNLDGDSNQYYTQIVNENPALKEVISTIKVLQKLGSLPIFDMTSVNEQRLSELKDEYKSLTAILKKINNKNLDSLSDKDIKTISESISYASYLFGYSIIPDEVSELITYRSLSDITESLKTIIDHLEASKVSKIFEPLVYKNEHSILGSLNKFLKPLVANLEDVTVASVHNDGKMYQSYVIPSYTSRLMDKFHLERERFKKFIKDEYDTPWFKEPGTDLGRGWKNSWLRTLVNNPEARGVLKHKISLNFNKKNYMKNMTESEYLLSVLTEYFSSNPKDGRAISWYRIPMQSNKPASEFIRFYSERGTNYKEILTDGFYDIFLQELSRIQTVVMRDLSPSDPTYIKNFDKNGKKFCFLDYFNSELNSDSELGNLIKAMINGEKLSPKELLDLEHLAKAKIKEEMSAKVNSVLNSWEKSGITEAAKSVQGISSSYIMEDLENFIWNDTFAAMNILQLTITDVAYYKDAEDLQKRLAQLHAPGIRGNVFARDYDGNLVSEDQKERVIYLKDFDSFRSNIIENIRIIFDRKIEQAPESEKAGLIALKESLIKEPVYDENGKEIERGGSYWYINVADAQAYSSITSYRKKAFMFGKWSKQAEEVYEKIKLKDYNYTELKAAFQPLKPFTYSQVQVGSGVDTAPLSTLKMGVQHKDSEYLLIMAGAILQGEDTGRPNLLRVINEIMEESADKNKGRGIDTVMFESSVKAGLTGVIDLSPYANSSNGEVEAKAYLESILYNDALYNSDYIHEIPFSDYSLQQEVPSHFADHEQAHGSQIRYITISDLEPGSVYRVGDEEFKAEELKKEYEETIATNIKESIDTLIKDFKLDSLDPKERRKAISRLLIDEIRNNPRYGIDMLYACSIDPKTGNFRIPLGDPIQSKRVEQLLNSIVKNRINKQEISGGPVVQVTNFGTSKELNIRFNSRSGGLLLTRKEFEEKKPNNYSTYEEYIKAEQAGIAYFEVFAPAYNKGIYEKFMDPKGTIDIKAIEKLDPELLKMIGYRIPTEDKYSTLPLKIVGFMPKEAGEGIMMPNDITLITGSDYDIDKMYLMIKKLDIDPKSRKDISKSLWDKFSPKYKTFSEKNELRERINMFLDNPQMMSSHEPEMWEFYKNNAYKVTSPKEGTRYYRDNKIIDMTYAILTHETTADKILNPGNFEEQKKMGYIAVAKKITDYSYEQLYAMDVETLKKICYTDKNLNFIDTHVQFYKQNSAAGTLIGTFAVHKVAHAILEGDNFRINAAEVSHSKDEFTIAGFTFTSDMEIDPTRDTKGNLIGKTLGCMVASAVDAVKDPVLNLMNINSNTSSVLTTLVRLGMPFEDAALFISQSCITDLLSSFEMEKLVDSGASLKGTILSVIQAMKDNGNYSSQKVKEPLTKEELIEGLSGYSPELQLKVLSNLHRILLIADQIKTITYVTRLNSISNSVGPLVVDNLIMEYKLSESSGFITKNGNDVTTLEVLKEHPILREFFKALDVASKLLSDMPTNSRRFRSLIAHDPRIEEVLYSDRKLLSQLSDFYQSFCFVESGVINSDHLPNYIDNFPLYFIAKNFKEKYKDNALIQATKYSEEDGRLVLKVDISGLKSSEKELLSAAWADLHKMDPKLSTQLFTYNFFRSGIGFSPKTFNNLLPSFVKERIEGYTNVFNADRIKDVRFILDLFIRHNWDNDRLVPWKSYKKVFGHMKDNVLTLKEECEGLPGINYFKMRLKDKLYIFRRIDDNTFKATEPLGNNGEYIEISLRDGYTPLNIPKTALSKLQSEVNNKETESDLTGEELSDIEMQARADLLLEIFNVGTVESTKEVIKERYRNISESERASKESAVKEFISKKLEAFGLNSSIDHVEKLYNDLVNNENLCS